MYDPKNMVLLMERAMTDEEIKISYRDAKYKLEQIKILAHLNNCKRGIICEILNVEDVETLRESNRSNNEKIKAQRDADWLYMYTSGCSDVEIADKFNVKVAAVEYWRYKNKLYVMRSKK